MLSNVFRRIFSFPAMLLTGLLVSPFFASLDVQQGGTVIRDPDIWWHLHNAGLLLSTLQFPVKDVFSFTAHSQPWINPEWLAEIPYYLGFRLLGERGIFLVMLSAVELLIAGVFFLCYRRSGDVKAAFLATWVGVLLATINIGPRTILFGWLCFIGELLLLEAFRRGEDRIWLLVPLFALWVNLHGSWLIGFIFLLLFIASGQLEGTWGSIVAVRWTSKQRQKLIGVAVAAVAAVFFNPYGWRLVVYPFDLFFRQQFSLAMADEWGSVDFQSFYGELIFLVIAAMLILTLARRRAWPLHELLFALFAFYAGLTHKHFLFLIGIVVCPMLAIELEGAVFAPYDAKRNKPLLSAAIMAAYLVFALDHIPTSAELRTAEARYLPVRALPALQADCANRRVLNSYEWGGYLTMNAPGTPVFTNSSAGIFEYHGLLADDLNVLSLNDSLRTLDQNGIGCALLSPNYQLVYLLRNTPGWQVGYGDSTATLLVRASETSSR